MPTKLPRLLTDVAIAVATLAGTLGLLSRGLPVAPLVRNIDLAGALLATTGAAALLFRRRYPLGVFIVAAGTDTALAAMGYRPGAALTTAVALYGLASARALSRGTTAIVLGAFAAWAITTGLAREVTPVSDMLHGGLALATGWFAGERARLRRAQIAQLEDRARRAEQDAERERRLAVAEERARIARDLHDSAGHAINVIGVLAGAARLRRDPERSNEALEQIEGLARDTVDELDQILRTLRDGRDETAPAGLASLDTLVTHHTSCGLEVCVEAAGAARPLTGSVDQAAYRILQEALTNAARHGVGAAHVELAFRDSGVALTVTNPVGAAGRRPTGGHGLIGMRERAELHGGRFDAGRINGSFRVHAELPYACHAS